MMGTGAVTLRQLRYLVALADTRHFGRAAEAAHVSQPSLSVQIRQLEETLGVQLVERTNRRVILTPAGVEAVARARRILAEVVDLAAAVRQMAMPLTGPLRLGTIPTLGPYYLPRVLPAVRQAFPELRLYLREDLTERLIERLNGGDLDVLLLALPVMQAGIEDEPLFDEPFQVAVPAGHRLCARDVVSEADLAGEHLLLLEDGHCLREQALSVCRLAGARDQDGFAATSLETLREMVASRIGVTLLPTLACTGCRGADSEALVIRPFAPPPPRRRIGLAWRRGTARAGEIRLLGRFLRDHLPPGVVPVAE